MKSLLAIRGFLPYVFVVFLNAFIDLGHKIVVQNTVFKVYDGNTQIALTAVVNALILLPFILLFSPSGFISDKYPKNWVMRVAAWAAVGLTLAITVCYYQGWFIAAFCMTFLIAVQSAFYSPAKYGFIKPLAGKESLGEANGVVQAVTIVSILMGTFVYSILFEHRYDPQVHLNESDILQAIAPLGWMLVLNSLLQLYFAYRIPDLEQPKLKMRFDWPDYLSGRDLGNYIRPVWERQVIRLSIIGLMMFWSISQVMLATFPAFAKEAIGETNTVMIQGTLAASGIGIMIGALVAGRFSRHHIETGMIPVGAAGISVGLFMIPGLHSIPAQALNFCFIGIMGGLFIVPLNALIQFHAGEREMGRVLAGNNLIQNIGMLTMLVLTVVLSYLGTSAVAILGMLFVIACCGSLYTVWKIPQSLIRFLLTYLMSRRYKVMVQGMRNIPESGGVLLLGNHISWIDWAIVQIASPRPIHFVMAREIYERWYLKWFFEFMQVVIPIQRGPKASESLQTMADLLDAGEVVCLFPEGTISRSGHLSVFRTGFERTCRLAKKDCLIVPFYLGGMWGSQFSRASEKLKTARSQTLGRDIVVAFGEPLPKDTHADTLKRKVFELSIQSWMEYAQSMQTLPRAWVDTVKRQGSDMAIASAGSPSLSAERALTLAVLISKRIRKLNPGPNVGLILPSSSEGMLSNMAVLLAGKTIVNLNYTAGEAALRDAVSQAELPGVLTSRAFEGRMAERGIDLQAILPNQAFWYLEDFEAAVSKPKMLSTRFSVKVLPASLLKAMYCRGGNDGDATAAILFSSGSEGSPKGVMLSHRNIMANLRQVADILNIRGDDVFVASLPLFHAFGLTFTQFLPLIEGLPVVCHPDPTDAMGVSKMIARYRATVFAGTSSFLRLYIKHKRVHPLMFDSMRLVISGAEKLSDDVHDAFKLKFKRNVYEGYGTTETSPVASVNLPDQLDTHSWQVQLGHKRGTVGMPLPGTSFRIVDPDSGVELPTGEAGMVLIGGCQVMTGYLNNEAKTAEVIVEHDGVRWYRSGDKGFLDADGFLTIVDRYSRFANIAGESVSLSAIENAVRAALDQPELELVAVNMADAAKGERVVLLYASSMEPAEMHRQLRAKHLGGLMMPAQLIPVEAVLKLGSGKTDYGRARELAEMAIDQQG